MQNGRAAHAVRPFFIGSRGGHGSRCCVIRFRRSAMGAATQLDRHGVSACPVPHADGSRLSGELYAARLTGFSQRPRVVDFVRAMHSSAAAALPEIALP